MVEENEGEMGVVGKTVSAVTGRGKPRPMQNLTDKLVNDLGIEVSDEKKDLFRKNLVNVSHNKKLVVPKKKFNKWAFTVHDYNRIHIFEDYAKEAGFKTTPMHGSLIAAGMEQYVLGIMDVVNNFMKDNDGGKVVYSGHKIKFENPVYPTGIPKSAKVKWKLEDIVVNKEGINLNVLGFDNKDNKVVSSPKINFSYEGEEFDPSSGLSFAKDFVERANFEIKKGELSSYYDCASGECKECVSMMYPAAFIPATLLKLSSERTGKPEGTYRSMRLKFYNEPDLGIYSTLIRLPNPPRKKVNKETGDVEGFGYNFEALCMKEDKPVVGGKVICFSPKEFQI